MRADHFWYSSLIRNGYYFRMLDDADFSNVRIVPKLSVFFVISELMLDVTLMCK